MSNSKTPTAIDKIVGMRVRRRRRELHLTQEQLGQTLGLSFQQVQKYEKGTNRISAGTLYEIAAVLERPLEWFYEQEGIDWQSVLDENNSRTFNTCVELLVYFQNRGALNNAQEMLQCLKLAMQRSSKTGTPDGHEIFSGFDS